MEEEIYILARSKEETFEIADTCISQSDGSYYLSNIEKYVLNLDLENVKLVLVNCGLLDITDEILEYRIV